MIGAFNAGLLPAPLFGVLAERGRLFRPMFFGSFVVLALALAAMGEAPTPGLWIILALLAGLGVGDIATVAPLFVVDFTPEFEWDLRIGWLQGFNGAGQLIGLLLAGLIAHGPLAYGFWAASAFSGLALFVGQIGLPSGGHRRRVRPPPLAWGDLTGRFQPETPVGGLLQHSHHLAQAALRRLPKSSGHEFGRFLLSWALLNFGVAPFFAYYPLLMQNSYGIDPTATALLYALSAGVGVALFVLSGRIAQRSGPRLVFQLGLAARMSGFVVLAVLSLMTWSGEPIAAMLGFAAIMLAWPILSVSGTDLAARLTPIGEGAAMGLLAASNALATLLGTFLAGPIVEWLGFKIVPLIAIAGLSGAGMLMRRSRRRGKYPA